MMLYTNKALPPKYFDGVFIWVRGGNTGDELIKEGCLKFLKEIGLGVWEDDGSIESAALAGDKEYLDDFFSSFSGFIFFTGGGNIGIYPRPATVRTRVIKSAVRSRGILVFPQSAFLPEDCLRDLRVTIWTREIGSYQLLRSCGLKTELVPDAALAIDSEIPKQPTGEGLFFIRRAPGRCRERIEHNLMIEAPSEDITFDQPLQEIIKRLSPYRLVVSDRMHGGIISLMMHKRTAFLPVNYHKNRSFVATWFSNIPWIAFLEREDQLAQLHESEVSPEIDLAGLFRSKAIPAFKRFLDNSTINCHKVLASKDAPIKNQKEHRREFPRMIAISCVKNEEDIIEAFVRHTATFVDAHVILDNESTDKTPVILDALAKEGLSIEIVQDPSIGYLQWQRMTNLLCEHAITHLQADWVLPLDADEFLVIDNENAFYQTLEHQPGPVMVAWKTYVPGPSDNVLEVNPAIRIQNRLESEARPWRKVLVPWVVGRRDGVALAQGSHGVSENNVLLQGEDINSAYLAHLPVRSSGQWGTKVIIGVLQYLAMYDKEEGWGSHHNQLFALLRQDPKAFFDSWCNQALFFAADSKDQFQPNILIDPIPYRGGPLHYTPSPKGSWQTLQSTIQYAEELARAYADLSETQPPLREEINKLKSEIEQQKEEVARQKRTELELRSRLLSTENLLQNILSQRAYRFGVVTGHFYRFFKGVVRLDRGQINNSISAIGKLVFKE